MNVPELKAKFDDIVVEDGYNQWSTVCDRHIDELNVPDEMLDSAGIGICGVAGCTARVDNYIDFPEEE